MKTEQLVKFIHTCVHIVATLLGGSMLFVSGQALIKERWVMFWFALVVGTVVLTGLVWAYSRLIASSIESRGWPWEIGRVLEEGDTVKIVNPSVFSGESKQGMIQWIVISTFPYQYKDNTLVQVKPQQVISELRTGYKYQWTGSYLVSVTD